MSKELHDLAEQNSIAFDKIFNLAVSMANGDELKDALVYGDLDLEEAATGLSVSCEALESYAEGDDDCGLIHNLYLQNKMGFLVVVKTPKPTRFSERGFSQSWGYCRLKTVYGETIDEVMEQAIEWRKEIIEEARKEQN